MCVTATAKRRRKQAKQDKRARRFALRAQVDLRGKKLELRGKKK